MSQPSQDVLRTFGQDPIVNPYDGAFSLSDLISFSKESLSTAITDSLGLDVGLSDAIAAIESASADSLLATVPSVYTAYVDAIASNPRSTSIFSSASVSSASVSSASLRISDPGDTIPTARSSNLSSDNPDTVSTVSNIGRGNDVDFYSFQLDAGDTVRIDIDSTSLDSVLRLFDSEGNQVAFSDDDPAPGESFSSESYIEFTASESDTYYVGVSGFANLLYDPFRPTFGSDSSTGFYAISADITPGDDGGGGGSDFQIDIVFTDDSLSASQQAIFQDAANRWAEIITGDLPDVSLPEIGLIDDLVIRASAPEIDGVGNILGQAGPTNLRAGSFLPIAGVMEFDAADLDQLEAAGQLENVILHEMGHVLGIGTIWTRLDLITGSFSNDPQYVGEGAIAEYNDIFGLSESSVPVENTGGLGTRNGHWRESILDNELMTGFLNNGVNPLSSITVASLGDLGYEVNLGAADPYSPPTSSLASQSSGDSFGNSIEGVDGFFLGVDAQVFAV